MRGFDPLKVLAAVPKRLPEILFKSGSTGTTSVTDCVQAALVRSPASLRDELTRNILVCGGTAKIHGFAEFLATRLQERFTESRAARIRVTSAPDPLNCSWLGVGIFANHPKLRAFHDSQESIGERDPEGIWLADDYIDTELGLS